VGVIYGCQRSQNDFNCVNTIEGKFHKLQHIRRPKTGRNARHCSLSCSFFYCISEFWPRDAPFSVPFWIFRILPHAFFGCKQMFSTLPRGGGKVNRVYGSLLGGTVNLECSLPDFSLYWFVMHALRNRRSKWPANWDREMFFGHIGCQIPAQLAQKSPCHRSSHRIGTQQTPKKREILPLQTL